MKPLLIPLNENLTLDFSSWTKYTKIIYLKNKILNFNRSLSSFNKNLSGETDGFIWTRI